MKIIILLISSLIIFINALPVPKVLLEKRNLYDVRSIAESYMTDGGAPPFDFNNDIEYPKNGDVWHVGQKVEVKFKDSLPKNQTVSIFFYQLTDVLAGGSLEKKTFEFVVPPIAISPPGGYSQLLTVRRVNNYLNAVDSVNVTVVP